MIAVAVLLVALVVSLGVGFVGGYYEATRRDLDYKHRWKEALELAMNQNQTILELSGRATELTGDFELLRMSAERMESETQQENRLLRSKLSKTEQQQLAAQAIELRQVTELRTRLEQVKQDFVDGKLSNDEAAQLDTALRMEINNHRRKN